MTKRNVLLAAASWLSLGLGGFAASPSLADDRMAANKMTDDKMADGKAAKKDKKNKAKKDDKMGDPGKMDHP